MPEATLGTLPPPAIVAFGARDRARGLLKRAFPRRRGRLSLVRSRDDLLAAIRSDLVDAVVVDLAQPTESHWSVAALARDFPSIPFLALLPLRPADLPHAARACTEFEFADVLAEGVDDAMCREILLPLTFTVRFAAALQDASATLGFDGALQQEVWRLIVAHGGRTVRTDTLAAAVSLTREHLSRRFSAGGGPNLKRVIDLARLLAASELAKNPGLDLPDVARILGFASATHLSGSCQRLIGVKSTSLARLRPADLLDRFLRQGRARSRSGSAKG
jgi:AraC-like DNA-binding protein